MSSPRNKRPTSLLLIFSGALVLLSGCETYMTKSYSLSCAWCSRVIATREYNVSPSTGAVYAIDGETLADPLGGKNVHQHEVGNANRESIESITGRDLDSSVNVRYEGHSFCSLRCLNAYKASSGIKEQRQRIIIGE